MQLKRLNDDELYFADRKLHITIDRCSDRLNYLFSIAITVSHIFFYFTGNKNYTILVKKIARIKAQSLNLVCTHTIYCRMLLIN